jgi:sigma-B regulation protein RsbU (phosphoserine phosphatase)
MLIISLLPLFVTGFVSYYSLSTMRDSITEISDQMGIITAGSSGNAIRTHIRENNTLVARLRAKLVDERLSYTDGDIEGVADIIRDTIDPNTQVFLLGDDGSLLIDSDGNFINGAENYNESDDLGKRFIARAIANDDTYSVDISVNSEPVYFAYAECKEIPASVVVIIPEAIADEDVHAIGESVIALNRAVTEEVQSTLLFAMTVLMGTVVFAALAAMIMALRFANRITVPIEKLTDEVSKINGDDSLSMQIDIRTGDEVEALADSFNLMTERLHGFITQLEKSTAEKERASAELSLVKTLQDMAFPHIAPGYLDSEIIDIYGTKKENGGQGSAFYNYFPINSDVIAVIMGEVSGSGITGAVKMLVAKTLLEQEARSGKPLDLIFFNVNNILFENEKTELNISAFMAYINIADKTFDYITAGINSPLVKRSHKNFETLESKENITLGVHGNIRFFANSTTLTRGDKVFIYTKKIENIEDVSGEIFGQDRLLESVNAFRENDIQEICDKVYQDICSFADETPGEDIMMMAAEFTG